MKISWNIPHKVAGAYMFIIIIMIFIILKNTSGVVIIVPYLPGNNLNLLSLTFYW